jgi:DNA repair protein RAD16
VERLSALHGGTQFTCFTGTKVQILTQLIVSAVEWHRIILDEAHRIKQSSSSTAYAAGALKASYRWCLTGTPLQNRLGDLYSMLRFLRWSPWADYLCSAKADGCLSSDGCPSSAGKETHEAHALNSSRPTAAGKASKASKACGCRRTTFDFGIGHRKCLSCGHAPMRHYSYFNRCILTPIQRYGYRGMGRLAYRTLREEVLAKGVLRRTKDSRHSELLLPSKQVLI